MTTFTSEQPLLSVSKIAKQFGLGTQTVRRWITSGGLKHLRIGGSIRIKIEDVQAFIEASTKRTTV